MKRLLMAFAILLMVGFVSAQQQSLPPVRQGECINLLQTCPNCTFVNITSVVNEVTIFNISATMQKTGTFYNYTFCNTTRLDSYLVNWVADNDGERQSGAYDFFVTATGDILSTSTAILYIFIILLSAGIFSFLLFLMIKIPSSPERNPEGDITNIKRYNKQLKYFLGVVCYLLFLWITYVAYNLSIGYFELASIGQFMWFLHRTTFILLYPTLVGYVIISIITFLRDTKLTDMVKRGLNINEKVQ